ncbi:MAG: thioredoxin domain-containing protein [Candidatus Tectomicrobia bacterium]|uniref:Thioredoxin domain-containing protein n=1 Tax=Tectimicrobiota bacterium TaxID=2528274 RepID=A0A932FVC9_UNCTE|nr:thioredoxin domain-containing protein [Candidatus Tectomicrobia bacterium]
MTEAYPTQVRLVVKDFPLDSHKDAAKAAEAARCAGEQQRFWEYHDKLFTNTSLGISNLKLFAKELNLNTQTFDQCLDEGKYRSLVEKDLAEGQNLGVTGTPTFFVNGRPIFGQQSFDRFKKLIDRELAKQARP